MNEIERAIELISAGEIDYSGVFDPAINKDVETIILEALREKQARSQGCDYCLKTHPKHDGHSHIWHGNMLDIGYGVYLDVNYCPKCGRKLTANVEIASHDCCVRCGRYTPEGRDVCPLCEKKYEAKGELND
jgi:RNA polymerase subunit RPABC4/transcription elongation factor Spt4